MQGPCAVPQSLTVFACGKDVRQELAGEPVLLLLLVLLRVLPHVIGIVCAETRSSWGDARGCPPNRRGPTPGGFLQRGLPGRPRGRAHSSCPCARDASARASISETLGTCRPVRTQAPSAWAAGHGARGEGPAPWPHSVGAAWRAALASITVDSSLMISLRILTSKGMFVQRSGSGKKNPTSPGHFCHCPPSSCRQRAI